ncbi:MAG: hypothetical protein Q9170_001072 [Blastenia crenularia]
MSTSANKSGIIPATLAFLTIYNPSLSQSDDTIEEQIVYYYSRSESPRRRVESSGDQGSRDKEIKNEKLRQIGLAQGMVEFANPPDPKSNVFPSQEKLDAKVEYSAREVTPPALLLEQVIQAHQMFLLHHARTLSDLFSRLHRPKFCAVLGRFWENFIWHWDVLLHGNPAIDIFNGLKLAAGGELGIGVGEEEWGSGEREVLEGFVGRTDGLVDLIVSRFGEAPVIAGSNRASVPAEEVNSLASAEGWHLGQDPRPSDGVIFSGVGAIGRPSVKYISNWVVSLFKHGWNAYGIKDNPVAVNRRRQKKVKVALPKANFVQGDASRVRQSDQVVPFKPTVGHVGEFGIPASIVRNLTSTYNQPVITPSSSNGSAGHEHQQTKSIATSTESMSGTETLMKYMTFGLYGSRSGTPSTDASKRPLTSSDKDRRKIEGRISQEGEHMPIKMNAHVIAPGYFMVGLQGDLDDENDNDDDAPEVESTTDREGLLEKKATSSRILIRTLVVARVERADGAIPNDPSSINISHDRLRVVVYVNRPFIFTFLFDLQTDSLAIPSFYRSLHHQLGPLQQPLLNSTSPGKVSERLLEASTPKSTATTCSSQPICDLVYDPYNLTVHTTIPNIPEPGSATNASAAGKSIWTRVEALSAHSQILNTYISTRRHASELERTCKTNRGWWVVWMRLPHVAASQRLNQMVYREAFLIRKSSGDEASTRQGPSGRWGRNARVSSRLGPGKLAEGIGIDARQYIEGLVSLNR